MERYDEAFVRLPSWAKKAELEYDMYIKDLIRAIIDQAPHLEQTCTEVAREFGISSTRLSQVVQAYGWRWPIVRTNAHVEARAAKRRKRAGLNDTVVTVDGRTATVAEHLDRKNTFTLATVRRRIAKGMTIEEALTTPKMSIHDRTVKASAASRRKKRNEG